MSLPAIFAVLLAVSLAGNAWLHSQWTDEQQAHAVTRKKANEATDAADQCSQATERLQILADQRKREADAARAAARKTGLGLEASAQIELATPATAPGDDCRSATERAQRWLQGRVRP